MNRDDYEEFSIKGKRANMKIHYIIKKRGRNGADGWTEKVKKEGSYKWMERAGHCLVMEMRC